MTIKISWLPTKNQILDAKIEGYVLRARQIGIEPGWLWLKENGFKRRVPPAVRQKIAEYEESEGR